MISMGKIVKDSDLLNAMEMFLDYESTVYGFNGHYYNTNLYETDRNEFDVHSLDSKEGKIWMDNSINEASLDPKQVESLKASLYLYY